MNLTQRCRNSTSELIRSRGTLIARQGKVRFLKSEADDLFLSAIVRASSSAGVYSISIDWQEISESVLTVSCTCPYALDHTVCKHIWAVLVDMERFGQERRIPGAGPLLLEPALPTPELPSLRAATQPSAIAAANALPAPSSWRQRIQELDRQVSLLSEPTAPIEEREIWFLVERERALSPAGSLQVEFFQRQRKANGEFGLLKTLSLARTNPRGIPPALRPSLDLLLDLSSPTESWRYSPYGTAPTVSSVNLPFHVMPLLLPRLCASGHFGWRDANRTITPIAWDDGPPWQVALFGEEDPDFGLLISGRLEREGETRSLFDPLVFLVNGLVLFADQAARWEPTETYPWIRSLRVDGDLKIPANEMREAAQALWIDPHSPRLHLPESLVPKISELAGTPRIELAFHSGQVYGRLRFVYPEETVGLSDPRALLAGSEEGTSVKRDRAAELAAAAILTSEAWLVSPHGELLFQGEQLTTAIATIHARGWEVAFEGRLVRNSTRSGLRVESGIDWFDLWGDFDFEGVQAPLPALLRAVKERSRFVLLGDGTLGLIPAEWQERLGALAQVAPGSKPVQGESETSFAIRFGAHQALVLDALLAAESEVQVDAVFARARERLRGFARLEPQPAPRGFTGELRAYQELGLAWFGLLADLGLGGCLADDMGLGKTVQLLAHLADRQQRGLAEGRPSLLVVPKSVVPHWTAEAARFTPTLRVGVLHGVDRHAIARELDRFDVLVTTYATLRVDLAQLHEREFDLIVLDEAQAIKNGSSLTAKACRQLRARHRLALTGTPVENHLGELWSLFEFLNPGLLGMLPALSDHAGKTRLPPEALAAVARALKPLMLRRTKEQVLGDLPAKTEQTLHCELSPSERKHYDQLRDHYRQVLLEKVQRNGFGRSKIIVLEALLRLRQAACHVGLIDRKKSKAPSAKLELLIEQLQEVVAGGHKALVFSQFTSFLALVRPKLVRAGIIHEYLDGKTVDRQAKVDRFQNDPASSVFLISLKAGGVGLNLTAASYVFLLDPWWNPAVEAQAIDRTHRIGQTRAVFAYRLIAKDTVEEKILELQAEKRALADAIMSQDQRLVKSLTVEDLERLLG
jgi:superfamily II DNA or RNA helicase